MTTTLRSLTLALLCSLSLPACVPLLVTGAGTAVSSTIDRRSYGVQLQDQEIELRLLRALNREFDSKANISTTAFNKRVLLSGQALTEQIRTEAERLARTTPNVSTVFNEVTVGWPATFGTSTNDRLITTKVKGRLLDPDVKGVSGHHVKVVTESGTVFLMGLLSKEEARIAVETARHTSGVLKVVDLIEVISDDEVRRLNEALKPSQPAEPQR